MMRSSSSIGRAKLQFRCYVEGGMERPVEVAKPRVFNSEFLIEGKAYDILFRQGKIRPTIVGNWLRGLIQRRGLLTREKI